MERRRRVRPGGRSADDDAALGAHRVEGALPCGLADGLYDDVRTAARGGLDRRDDVLRRVVDGHVGAERLRMLELRVARRRDDHLCAERLGE